MNRPNILWIMTDEQRRDTLGCYGSPWAHSPAVDGLAEAGVRFANAYTSAPLCVPARTNMMTGLAPSDHGVWSNAELGTPLATNLVGRFREAGYATASLGKSHYSSHQETHLFDTEVDQWYGSAVHPEYYRKGYDESAYGVVKYPSPYTNWIMAGRYPEAEEDTGEWRAVTDALEWLEEHRSNSPEQPFFLRVSFNGPHTPVTPPERWLDAVDPEAIDIPEGTSWDRSTWPRWYRDCLWEYARSDRLSAEQIGTIRHHYYAQSAFVDSQVARLLEYADDNGLTENTIVVFCSDHGTHLGDYGFVQKQTLFEPVMQVPFIFRLPENGSNTVLTSQKSTGRVVDTPINTASLLPTLLELCSVPVGSETIRYPSLAGALQDSTDPAELPVVADYTLGSILKWGFDCSDRLRMVRFGKWKLGFSLDNDAEGLLFDLNSDPMERNNLFGRREYADVVAEIRNLSLQG